MLRLYQRLSISVFNNRNSLLTSHYVKKYLQPSAALCSVAEPSKPEATPKKYYAIYTFNRRELIFASIVNRLKYYAIAYIALGVPYTFITVGPGDAHPWIIAFIGVAGFGALCGAGVFTRNMIGIIELSEDKKFLRFSFMSFWGKKVVLESPLDKVSVIENKFALENKFYVQFYLEDHGVPVRLMKGKATIDKKLFPEVFGPTILT